MLLQPRHMLQTPRSMLQPTHMLQTTCRWDACLPTCACGQAGLPWALLQPLLQPVAERAPLGPPCLHLLAVGRVGRVHTRHKARRTSSVKAPAHTHMAHWGPFRGCVWNQSPPNCMMRTCGKGSGEGRVCGGGVSPQQQQTADWKDFEV